MVAPTVDLLLILLGLVVVHASRGISVESSLQRLLIEAMDSSIDLCSCVGWIIWCLMHVWQYREALKATGDQLKTFKETDNDIRIR
jgi:hypothetical protein